MADHVGTWDPIPGVIMNLHSLGPSETNEEKKKKKKVSRAYGALKRADEFLSEYPMKWKRVMGMGGFGVAVKYERIGPDGHPENVIVKVDKKGSSEDFVHEWKWYKRFQGSEHIPQVIDDLQRTTEDPTYPDGIPKGMSTFVLGSRRLMVMEYLEYGDLMGLVQRQTEHYLKTGDYSHIPDRLLWGFFLCLARSCMALAWPRKSAKEVSDEYQGMDDFYMNMRLRPGWKPPSIPEVRRERPQATAPCRIVHFDMDPQNVLVGDPRFNPEGDKEHESAPILKLNDFGLTTEFTGHEYLIELDRYRNWGKRSYMAPEQGRDISEDTFTAQTNIWGIGIIMFAVITRCFPLPGNTNGQDARFMCKRDTVRDEDGDETMGEGDDPGRVEKVVKDTVHARSLGILDDGSEPFADVDATLRALVARCMCEDPRARPTLAELEAELTKGLDAAFRAEAEQAKQGQAAAGNSGAGLAPTDGPEYLREFVQHFFRDAPALPSDKNTWLPAHTPSWVFSTDRQDWNAIGADIDDELARILAGEAMRWGTPEQEAVTSGETQKMIRNIFGSREKTTSANASGETGHMIRTMFRSPWQTTSASDSAGTGNVMKTMVESPEQTSSASAGIETGMRNMFMTRSSPEQPSHPEW